jgi:hypothetical protein
MVLEISALDETKSAAKWNRKALRKIFGQSAWCKDG